MSITLHHVTREGVVRGTVQGLSVPGSVILDEYSGTPVDQCISATKFLKAR